MLDESANQQHEDHIIQLVLWELSKLTWLQRNCKLQRSWESNAPS